MVYSVSACEVCFLFFIPSVVPPASTAAYTMHLHTPTHGCLRGKTGLTRKSFKVQGPVFSFRFSSCGRYQTNTRHAFGRVFSLVFSLFSFHNTYVTPFWAGEAPRRYICCSTRRHTCGSGATARGEAVRAKAGEPHVRRQDSRCRTGNVW